MHVMTRLGWSVLGLACAAVPALVPVSSASAQVPSPPGCRDGRPTGLLAVFSCICEDDGVCNIGEPCPSETSCDDGMNSTCESRMYHVFNDNTCIPSRSDGLDPAADARTEPETFAPVCGLTFTVESRGTARFRSAFGWYNITGSAPSHDDLHVMLDCDDGEGATAVLDVRGDPAYRGGEIGFFLVTPESHTAPGTCAGEPADCCATVERAARGEGRVYFSESRFNPDAMTSSVTHLLIYDSIVWERKFYFAWEDTFGASNNDYTDLVTSVEGVECGGGGAACETGRPGACARGVTRCEGGTVSCVPVYEGAAERCDGTDDDCDMSVDEDAPCPEGETCHNGSCVPPCELGVEFACPLAFDVCEESTRLCVEPACVGVSCEAGEVCRAGACVGECDGVVCPHGLDCALDTCRDGCEGVSCAAGTVCRGGICVPGCNQCNGISCRGGERCDDATGECEDASCATACPEGTHCESGTCVDSCVGAVCPRGQICSVGRCIPMLRPGEDGGPGPGMRDGGTMTDADGGTSRRRAGSCGCRVGSTESGAPVLGLLGLVAALATFRRRRRR